MICSAADPQQLALVRRRVFLALFIALAVALHTFETLLPNPLPWLRLGLANILGLTALFLYGVRALWLVSVGRILVGSLVLGSLFSPGFLLSLSGGLLAALMMTIGFRSFAPRIGPVGVSILGALGHVTGQLLVAWLLVVRHSSIWMMSPFFLLFALISGMVNGIAADMLLESLRKHPAFDRLEPLTDLKADRERE